jgi:hypothetical protein
MVWRRPKTCWDMATGLLTIWLQRRLTATYFSSTSLQMKAASYCETFTVTAWTTWPIKMGLIGISRNVGNYQSSLCNVPEEQGSQQYKYVQRRQPGVSTHSRTHAHLFALCLEQLCTVALLSCVSPLRSHIDWLFIYLLLDRQMGR